MKLPNADNAVIAPEKLRDYLLDREHVDGGPKAVLLLSMGYSADDWRQLESDLREQHLPIDVQSDEDNEYGTCYVIVAELRSPDGRSILFRSVWQIDIGTDLPRFITMYPEKR